MTAPAITGTTRRPTIAGTATVVRFNWPKYVGAAVLLVAALGSAGTALPAVLRAALWAVALAGGTWSATSIVATWWIYDHRRVYTHVPIGLGDVGRWASIHAGFDDATPVLTEAIGAPPASVVELEMVAGASLRRARNLGRPVSCASPLDVLPFGSGSMDTIFVTFAAHEVRDGEQQVALFAELARSLRVGGRLVVTEHSRDLANVAVYGPGALHFQRAAVWRRRAAEAGLVRGGAVDPELAITPFVRRFTWQR